MNGRRQGREHRQMKKPMQAPRMLEAIVKAPGARARVTMVVDDPQALASIVDGQIEIVAAQEYTIVCNADRDLLGLAPNVMGLSGTIVVLGGRTQDALTSVRDARSICAALNTEGRLSVS